MSNKHFATSCQCPLYAMFLFKRTCFIFPFSVLAFHPESTRKLVLGAADDAAIVGWDFETGKPHIALKGHFSKVCALVIHPDNKHIVR